MKPTTFRNFDLNFKKKVNKTNFFTIDKYKKKNSFTQN